MKLNRRSFCFAAKLIVVLVVLTVALSVLAACATDKMKQAEKDGDNYKIMMSYDPETHTLSATQLTEVTNRTNNTFTKIMFHIYANAYREGAEPIVPTPTALRLTHAVKATATLPSITSRLTTLRAPSAQRATTAICWRCPFRKRCSPETK